MWRAPGFLFTLSSGQTVTDNHLVEMGVAIISGLEAAAGRLSVIKPMAEAFQAPSVPLGRKRPASHASLCTAEALFSAAQKARASGVAVPLCVSKEIIMRKATAPFQLDEFGPAVAALSIATDSGDPMTLGSLAMGDAREKE